MKTLAVLLVITLSSSVRAAEFAITGHGKVFYTVDKADIRFSVSVRDKNVQEFKTMHDAIVEKLNEYLKKQKYPKEILSLETAILKRDRGSGRTLEDDYIPGAVRLFDANRSNRRADLTPNGHS